MKIPMHWTVARAKQKLSELLRAASHEPQKIFNRGRLVAVVVHPEVFQEFQAWRKHTQRSSIGSAFTELRKLCVEEGYVLEVPERQDSPNAIVDTATEVRV